MLEGDSPRDGNAFRSKNKTPSLKAATVILFFHANAEDLGMSFAVLRHIRDQFKARARDSDSRSRWGSQRITFQWGHSLRRGVTQQQGNTGKQGRTNHLLPVGRLF